MKTLFSLLLILVSVSVFGQAKDSIVVKKDSVVVKQSKFKFEYKVVPKTYLDIFTGEEYTIYWIESKLINPSRRNLTKKGEK